MRPRLATPGNILYNREKIILRGERRREKGTTRMKKIGLLLALLALLMAALPGALAEPSRIWMRTARKLKPRRSRLSRRSFKMNGP